MKKFMSLVLMGSMVASAGTAFAAANNTLGENDIELLCSKNIIKGRENGVCLENKVTKAEALALLLRAKDAAKPNYQEIIGEVLEIDEDGITIKGSERTIKVNLSGAVLRGKTAEDIKVGDTASAVISEQMTKSIPAMANGYVVNVSDKSSVSYFEVDKVEKIEDGYMVYDKKGEYIIAASDDTKVSPFKTRNIMNMQDISEGDRLAVISEVVTMSIPAVMNPDEIIVLDNNFSDDEVEIFESEEIEAKEEFKSIIGEVSEIDEEGIIIKNGEEEYKVNLSGAVLRGKSKEDIKVGDIASAVISSYMTKSIPPMTNGYVVNVSDKSSVSYFEVDKVEKIEYGYMVYDKKGEYIIAASDDTKVSPFKTRNIMNMQDISEGDRLAVISEAVTMSIPAVMNPTEIIVLEDNLSEENFDDTTGHWAEDDIERSLKLGYIKKTGENFAPDSEEVTAQFINDILENMGISIKLDYSENNITRNGIAEICLDIIK